ncbi:MAG: dihydrodipicolinate synthase family protein [Propionibacteriaceae bacterium]|jgi:4-hydroxy-tetrahydrodipicolinate synthase|nr:dihydrodipicolinate synthase family protein [Propionibacteriaceae bacterium]
MNSQRLRGIIPPIVTPLDDDGHVDAAALTQLTEHLISSGVHGIFVLSSTGEVAYLDDTERMRAIDTVAQAAGGRVPVLAGVIDLTCARVATQAKLAAACGASAVVTTAPLYALNDTAEIEDHFRRIAEASTVPVYAYDVPVRVRTKLSIESLIRLALEGVICGIKDSSGDDVGFRRLILANKEAGSPLQVFTGHEVLVDTMIHLGADGAVPGLANVDVAGYRRLWDATQAKDWDQARLEQARLATLFEITSQIDGRSPDASGVGSFKIAMRLQRLIPSARMSAPVQETTDVEVLTRIAKLLRHADLDCGGLIP